MSSLGTKTKFKNLRVSSSLHLKLKIFATQEGTTLENLTNEAITHYLEKATKA